MPRAARIKDPMAIYHTMSRSITEFDLFPDNSDKEYFLNLLQKCRDKYYCKVYGYCLMSNHYHLIIDTCGYDISKFMKSLNQSYVKYINKKYKRRGHLLTERFNSKIIDSDEYMLTVSAYVHNNPKDIPEYMGKEYEYPYSSMGIYLGKRKDKRNLVSTEFILGCINEKDQQRAAIAYAEMVTERRDVGINRKLREYLNNFQKEQYQYKPYREVLARNKKPEEIIEKITEKFGVKEEQIMHRWKRRTMELRRAVAYSLVAYCGMGIKEVSRYMYNITASCCAKLCEGGFETLKGNKGIKEIVIAD